jgi:cAMP-dependent protein kinase regulator
MPPVVDRFKRYFSLDPEVRKRKASLRVLARLQQQDPDEPTWPLRAAELLKAGADPIAARAALAKALGLQLARGLVAEAISTCEAMLQIEPDDEATLERLSGLLQDASAASESNAVGRRISRSVSGPPRTLVSEDCPDDAAAFESSDLKDLAAAQAVCLPIHDLSQTARAETQADRSATLRSQLANIPLFEDLDPASLHHLVYRARVVLLDPGQVLFREGDAANCLYVVVEGAVVPIAEGPCREKLAVLEAGAFFGEIGLVAGQPRNATLEALVDTKLLAIDRKVVEQLLAEQGSVASGIRVFLRSRLLDRQVRTNPFFTFFGRDERAAIARQFRLLEVEEGEEVVVQGHAPDGLYVVLSGSLEMVDGVLGRQRVGRPGLGRIASGDLFGGVSLLEGRPSVVSIVARTRCWVAVLGEGRFRRILKARPGLEGLLRGIARDQPVRPDLPAQESSLYGPS